MFHNTADIEFLDLLETILTRGSEIDTRNSITKRLTGLTCVFDSTPLVSVRRTAWKNALREMEWFLSGSSNIQDLHPSVHKWWQPWTDLNGEVKNNYSKQFRRFEGGGLVVDQIALLIDAVTNHPFSRRSVVTTWNAAEMVAPETKITNCHGTSIQVFVEPSGALDMLMFQRSSDMLLGLPHNWIQYWAFLLWLAAQTDKTPGKFTWIGGDCHIYAEHYEIAKELTDLADNLFGTNTWPTTPKLVYTGKKGDWFKAEDFRLDGEYKPLLNKSAKMVV